MKQSIVAHAPGNQALLRQLKDELVGLGCPEDAEWNEITKILDSEYMWSSHAGVGLYNHECYPAKLHTLTPATYPYVRNAFLSFYDLPVVPIEETELCEG